MLHNPARLDSRISRGSGTNIWSGPAHAPTSNGPSVRTEPTEIRCRVTTQAEPDAGAEITGEQVEEELGADEGKGIRSGETCWGGGKDTYAQFNSRKPT